MRKIVLTDVLNEEVFAIYHYEQARAVSRLDPEQAARRVTAGDVTMERFTAAVKASGGLFYITLLDDLDGCLAEIKALSSVLSERAGRDAPATSDIGAVVTMIRDEVASFSSELVERARTELAAAASRVTAKEEEKVTSEGRVESGGKPRGRDEALRNLQQIAEYFRAHEPHSPISTCLDELVRRARMPFAELLAELLPDVTAWRSVLTSAGIKPPEDPPPAQ